MMLLLLMLLELRTTLSFPLGLQSADGSRLFLWSALLLIHLIRARLTRRVSASASPHSTSATPVTLPLRVMSLSNLIRVTELRLCPLGHKRLNARRCLMSVPRRTRSEATTRATRLCLWLWIGVVVRLLGGRSVAHPGCRSQRLHVEWSIVGCCECAGWCLGKGGCVRPPLSDQYVLIRLPDCYIGFRLRDRYVWL